MATCSSTAPWLLALLSVAACLTAQAAESQTREKPEPVHKEGTIKFLDVDIAYHLFDIAPKEAGVPHTLPTAVFLHGAKYSSDFWLKLGTLQKVAQTGVRALAVDLPGFGKTRNLPYSDNNMRAELLKAIVEFATPKPNSTIILVSPSMSGRYALPFLDRHGTMITSWVALAPIGVKNWGGPWEDTHRKVCAMATYGADDTLLPEADLIMKFFANACKVVIPRAGHRSYEDQPAAFHDVLLKFLRKCYRKPNGDHEVVGDREVTVALDNDLLTGKHDL